MGSEASDTLDKQLREVLTVGRAYLRAGSPLQAEKTLPSSSLEDSRVAGGRTGTSSRAR